MEILEIKNLTSSYDNHEAIITREEFEKQILEGGGSCVEE